MRAGPKTLECHDEACITCSDLAIEAHVIEMLDDGLARVEIGGEIEVVSVALVDAHPGDSILLHAREAIAKLTA
ncbi:MAG: HypC/HybG/HupF family hydrogenase formation chaperone [Bryobacteraceae bacterium]